MDFLQSRQQEKSHGRHHDHGSSMKSHGQAQKSRLSSGGEGFSSGPLLRSKLQHFINARGTHPASDTHRDDPAFCLAPFQLMEELCSQLGTRASQRMTQGNGTAIGIDIAGKIPFFNTDGPD
jgi:hypothetical protein